MADVYPSYKNADAHGRAAFDVLDTYKTNNLLAGVEPGLMPALPVLLGDSLTLAQFSVVGLNSASKLALATVGLAAAATIGFGTGNGLLTVTAQATGEAGNSITVQLAAAGTAAIAVTNNAILVTPATGADTAAAVAAQINAHGAASRLVKATFGGTGGTAMSTAAATSLAGGVSDVNAIGVLAHGAVSEASNTTVFGQVLFSGCFNIEATSPLVWHASFDTEAEKLGAFAAAPNPTNIVVRNRVTS